MKAACPLLANAPARSARGAYTPLSRPTGVSARSLDTDIAESSRPSSRFSSPTPPYAASSSRSFPAAMTSVVDDNDSDFPRD